MAEAHPIPNNPRFHNLIGKRFGHLVVEQFAGFSTGKGRGAIWTCRCDCGVVKTYFACNIKRPNHSTSCGCHKKEMVKTQSITHGLSRLPIYKLWHAMIERCESPNSDAYAHYGGRGISVCERWHKLENFFADMGHRPRGKSLDRIDTNKGYSPENCRWASGRTQQNNRRNNTKIAHAGRTQTISQWASEAGISYKNLHNRVGLGWTMAKALSEPVRYCGRRSRSLKSS